MDQNTTGGTDKRNWRERLGIGVKDTGMKDMPRISEDFKPTPVAAKPAAPTVRPAPMAPRVVAKATSATPGAGAARPAAMAPDALANKLKAQRDAAEKLAEQRVQAARQRAEAAMTPASTSAAPKSNGSASKPKFSFADEEMKAANAKSATAQSALAQQGAARPAQTPSATQRPAALPPQAPAGFSPQIAPPRPQLGGGAPVPQRAPAAQAYPQGQVSQGQAYGQQPPAYVPSYVPQSPQGYTPSPQGYTQPPAYRSIDPASAYVPPPPFNPAPSSFGPQTRQPYGAPVGQQAQPRLQVPPRGQAADYGYETQPRPNSRLTNPGPMRAPAAYNQTDSDDIFEQPAPPRGQRRATANDYQQAYREVESGYDDEAPRSRVPWILAMLLAFVVVGFGSIWAYGNYIRPQIASTNTQAVPVVKAPATPTKIVPDAEAPTPDQAAQPSKKQIYDRIVGDREVLGGQIAPTEVTPVQPENNTQVAPASDPAAAEPSTGTGNDGTPLPLPPPPGGTGDGTQGSLEPAVKGDQQLTTITPAAGSSQAADSSPVVSGEPVITPPAPAKPSQVASAGTVETIQDTPEEPVAEAAAPVEKKVKLAPKKPAAAKVEKSLGSKPVVLVPPSKKVASAEPVESVDTAPAASSGLYGDTAVGNAPAAGSDGTVVPEAPVKKRRTLLDLFKTKDNTAEPAETASEQSQPEVLAPAKAPQKVAAATPPPAVQQSTGTGAYVAQLASFKTKAEASQEYNRMRAKHGEIVGRYAPIVVEAQVAGTTRYRLNIGPMASQDVASSLCRSLFAAGERDCLVHRL